MRLGCWVVGKVCGRCFAGGEGGFDWGGWTSRRHGGLLLGLLTHDDHDDDVFDEDAGEGTTDEGSRRTRERRERSRDARRRIPVPRTIGILEGFRSDTRAGGS